MSLDLMLTSSAEGLARKLSLQLQTAGDMQAASEILGQGNVRIIAVDLQCPGLNIATFVAATRQSSLSQLPIVAFGPHVHESNLAAAASAGCDLVLSRGQFDRQAGELLPKLLAR